MNTFHLIFSVYPVHASALAECYMIEVKSKSTSITAEMINTARKQVRKAAADILSIDEDDTIVSYVTNVAHVIKTK